MSDILSSYADNFSALESDADLETLSRKLQEAITPIVEWAARKKLTIAPAKSQVTLFSPFNKEYNSHLEVPIYGVDMPLCKFPKILGVTWDVMICFHKHVADIVAKAWQRLNLMKAVCGSSWGHNKETLILTFRAFVESVFSFASPIWFLNCKTSNIQKLQVIQNAAMRLITGCHKASPINHLHCETKLMPVAEHLSMLCSQYLASCLLTMWSSSLPDHAKTNMDIPSKRLSSKFLDNVAPHLSGGIMPEVGHKRAKNALHTDAVRDYLSSTGINPVLAIKPPDVHPSEETLPHVYRTTLAQFRLFEMFTDICPA
jgi:hypothetical protein